MFKLPTETAIMRSVQSPPKNSFALFGAESIFAAEVAESLYRLGFDVTPAIIDGPTEWDLRGLVPVMLADVECAQLSHPAAIPWVTPGFKYHKAEAARRCGFGDFPPVIDPHASVARSAEISDGVYVAGGAATGAFAVLAPFALVNRNGSIGHHSRLGAYASLGPGATIAARCDIGRGTMIGAGAVIAPGLRIGVNCLIAAGAVITRDIPDHVMAAGNPARVIETGYAGYKGVSVD